MYWGLCTWASSRGGGPPTSVCSWWTAAASSWWNLNAHEKKKKMVTRVFISSFRKLKWREHYQRSICDRSEIKKTLIKILKGLQTLTGTHWVVGIKIWICCLAHRRLARSRRACWVSTSTSLCAPRTTNCRRRSSLTKGRAATTGTWRPSARGKRQNVKTGRVQQQSFMSVPLTSS